MSGLADLADALAACDAAHFKCRECDAGEHDRPTLHAEEALAWFAERLGPIEALADQWNETPDYTASEYDQGRVDQRHDMTAQLLTALAAVREALGEEQPMQADGMSW